MSHDRKSALRAELVDAQRALSDALDRVGSEAWLSTSPTNEGWTVRELLVHLTTAEVGFVATLRRMAAGLGGVPTDFDPNRWNAGQVRRSADIAPEQLQPKLEQAHADMLALLETLDDTALDHRGHLSSGAEGSTEDNFRLVATHKRQHTGDIEAALTSPTAPGEHVRRSEPRQ